MMSQRTVSDLSIKSRSDSRLGPPPAAGTLADPVLRATYDSILEVGVRRTTLADVARRAGVSRMTVYRKYDDLPRLLSAMLTVELAELIESIEKSSRTEPDVRRQLAHMVTNAAQTLSIHPILAKVLAIDPEALLPLIVDRFGSTQRTSLEHVTAMVKAGQAPAGDGSIKAGDPDLLALTVLMSAQSLIFSARAVATVDPEGRTFDELEVMINAYLCPTPKSVSTKRKSAPKKATR